MSDFEQVLSKVRIEDVISKKLGRGGKKVGSNIDFGECPFCKGHDCFRVNNDKQFFHCFQCNIGGDAISFVRQHDNLAGNFEALKNLAADIGFVLTNGKDGKKRSELDMLREKIYSEAGNYYFQNLLHDEKALAWIKAKRFHTDLVIDKFMVGWTGHDAAGLYKHLSSFYSNNQLLGVGLIKENQGEYVDFFVPHVYIFPWFNFSAVATFSIKDPQKKIIYQLPKEKRAPVYFYNQADCWRDQIIIVEGENDLLTTWRAIRDSQFLKNFGVIAIQGQLSGEQITYLKKMMNGKELYCCFDNDAAGKKYTEKLISEMAQDSELFVINFEGVKDIDEFLREKQAPGSELETLVRNATDGIEWKISELEDCDQPLRARKVIQPLLETIAHIKDERLDIYIDLLAAKFTAFKRANIVKMLKGMGAAVGGNEIRNFEIYDSSSQIFVSNNSYWVPTKEDKRMISNFVFQLTNIYSYEDASTHEQYLKYECVMRNYKGVGSNPVVFEPEERVNVNKFMAKAASCGEFHFWGSAQNLLNVWSFVEHNAQDVKITNLIQKYGFVESHRLWLFENCAIKGDKIYHEKDGIINVGGHGFKSQNVLIYGGDKPKMNTQGVSPEFINDVIFQFWKVCDGHKCKGDFDSYKGLMLIGFIPAMIYRNEIMAKYNLFPILTCYGPSQTGKSVITQILFSFWGFSNPAEAWEGMTPPGLTQFLSQVHSLPVWLDEFRNNSNRFHKTLMGTLRNAYNGVAPGKGGLQKRLIYEIGGCIWMTGEDTPNDRATISRCAVARFTEINDVRDEAYHWFQERKDKLSAITVKLIKEKTKETAEQYLYSVNLIMGELLRRGISDERTRVNIAIPVAGFYMFSYRKDDDAFQERFLEYICLQAEEDKQRKAGEDILTRFFEDMSRLMDKAHFKNCVRIIDSEYLCFNFNEFYAEYKKELKQEGDNIDDFKKNTVRDYIVKSPFFVRPRDGKSEFVIRFNDDRTKRAFKLDIAKMPPQIRENFMELEGEMVNEDLGF